jgi:type I restriction enzyme S subunit
MNKIASAGKYVAYPEYKSSGVEWLGDMPVHWLTTKIKYGYDITLGKMLQKEAKSSEDRFRPYLKAINIQSYGVSLKQVGKMWFSPSDLRSLKLIDGDILISEGGDVGRSAIWRNELPDCYIQNAINRARPKMNRSSRFLFYWVNMLKGSDYIDILCNKATISHYTVEKVENSPLLIPSDDEAEKIANFLDHETAKIDTLIDKQQQLIKLLKEKRQAVISHAVTKGLNHDAPMRDSGVEWLGEVPRHWKMVPLKYLCNFSGGGTPSKDNLSYWTGGDIPWVSPKDMKSFWILDTQDKLTEKAVKESSTNFVNAGALLMVVRSGILQRTIPIAINKVKVTLNQDMKALKFNERMDAEYTANYIIGNVSSLLLEWSKEGATVESIEQEYLSGSLMPVPPLGEQAAINEVINDRMTVFQRLEEQALKGITLLQERRSALISAAVTGKIDVRNWSAPHMSNIAKSDLLTQENN